MGEVGSQRQQLQRFLCHNHGDSDGVGLDRRGLCADDCDQQHRVVGLAVTSHNNGTLCTSTFTGVQVTTGQPTVATPATANPSPVTGTTTNLSVLGADAGGEAALTYTWLRRHPAGARRLLGQRHQCREEHHGDVHSGRHLQPHGLRHRWQWTCGVQSGDGDGEPDGHHRQCRAVGGVGDRQCRQAVVGHGIRPVRRRFWLRSRLSCGRSPQGRFRLLYGALHGSCRNRIGHGPGGNRLALRHGRGNHHDASRTDRRYGSLCVVFDGRHLHGAFRAGSFHCGRVEPDLHLEPHRHAAGAGRVRRQRHERRQEHHRHDHQGRHLQLHRDNNRSGRADCHQFGERARQLRPLYRQRRHWLAHAGRLAELQLLHRRLHGDRRRRGHLGHFRPIPL